MTFSCVVAAYSIGLATFQAGGEKVSTLPPGPAVPEWIEKKDIRYFDGKGFDPIKHRLDLFMPKGANKAKVVVFVHGGAWVQGDKDFFGLYSAVGRFLAKNGVVAGVISYRLSPKVKHPAHAEDVARAVAWTTKNIGAFGGDPEKIFLCGHSAGGHLVSLVGCDPNYLKREGVNPGVIKGIISLSGVYDVSAAGMGMIFGRNLESKKSASPVYQVRPGLPPFLLICADKEFVVCSSGECKKFKHALEMQGNKVDFQEIPMSNHIKTILDVTQPDRQVSKAVLKFLGIGEMPRDK